MSLRGKELQTAAETPHSGYGRDLSVTAPLRPAEAPGNNEMPEISHRLT
jgi:hypothetical protein